jgi:hypothetical protein
MATGLRHKAKHLCKFVAWFDPYLADFIPEGIMIIETFVAFNVREPAD